MPARQFFAMLDAARAIKSHEKIDLCNIAAVSLGGKEYHDALVKSFRERVPGFKEVQKPKTVLKGKDALNAMRQMRR